MRLLSRVAVLSCAVAATSMAQRSGSSAIGRHQAHVRRCAAIVADIGALAPPCPRFEPWRPERTSQDSPPAEPAPLWAIAASALLPGAGQFMLGVDRFVPYLAVETYSWIQYTTHSRDARAARAAYRELASRIARSRFALVRPVGSFEYYERMEHFLESGRFDLVAGGVLDPETDSTTYNGSVWLLARRTFWPDVNVMPDTSSREWKAAIDLYVRRAYDQPFRWSWRNAQLEYDEFRRLIRRSNDAHRKAFQDLGVVLANHVLSTVDAYITVRLRHQSSSRYSAWQVMASLPLARLGR
jgi:hypothetical protein